MANDRMYIRCKGCGDLHFLAKCYDDGYFTTHEGEELRQGLDDFFDRHKWCYRDKYYGGFELVYESDEDAENEDDDERIRKWLVNYFKAAGKSWIHRDISPEQILAYLEKQKEPENTSASTMAPSCWADEPSLQKEQKVDIDKLRRELYQSGYNDGYQHGKEDAQKEQESIEPQCPQFVFDDILALECAMGIAYRKGDEQELYEALRSLHSRLSDVLDNEQKEQKPDTRDADDLQLLGFIYDLLNEIEWKDNWAMSKDECLRRLNNYRPQKSAEWKPQPESLEALLYAIEGEWGKIEPTSYLSRRLEDLYDGLVNTFDVDEKYLSNLPKTEYTEKDIEEIKALKEKIDSSMETKPEWSEEDEHRRTDAIYFLGSVKSHYADTSEIKKTILWLKSLRNRPKSSDIWKPSEEQMEALKRASTNEYLPAKQFDILVSLYEQLKKL